MKESVFKTKEGEEWLNNWHSEVFQKCQLEYDSVYVNTEYGKTHVWTKNHEDNEKPALLFLPGFRTCGVYWDLNNTLRPFYKDYRIYLLDIIGQPSLSSGKTPPVKGQGYSKWIIEVLDNLGLDVVVVSGASFGGLLALKLAAYAPERIKCIFGFNPVGIQFISLGFRSLWYNVLHSLFPTPKNIELYMRKMVLDPALNINPDSHRLLLEYQCYTIRNFKFRCDYPYKLSDEELKNIQTPLYLILCENDNLIQQKKTVERAKKIIPGFRQHSMLTAIGHGIEMSKAAYVEFEKFLNIEYKTD